MKYITIKKLPLLQIENKTKTIEGRLLRNHFKQLKENQIITFINKNISKKIICKIKKIDIFDNFKLMCKNINLKKLTPHLLSITQTLQLYQNIYKCNWNQYKVISIHLIYMYTLF